MLLAGLLPRVATIEARLAALANGEVHDLCEGSADLET